ncbi:hypothetical protein [Sinorhizobium meliloti]|uniref:Uncharacterized protein n=1 Tax=Rhizobium meliloti TaxID=382 RepID=A0A2J0YT69_RHIML|nr:hypothetical protein [Sinorhizobium meliloti]PJR08808.1 hypothetical protein CEJ86_32110 [Sinorhizobium meliloti]
MPFSRFGRAADTHSGAQLGDGRGSVGHAAGDLEAAVKQSVANRDRALLEPPVHTVPRSLVRSRIAASGTSSACGRRTVVM